MAVLDDQGEMKVDIFRDILDEQECIKQGTKIAQNLFILRHLYYALLVF